MNEEYEEEEEDDGCIVIIDHIQRAKGYFRVCPNRAYKNKMCKKHYDEIQLLMAKVRKTLGRAYPKIRKPRHKRRER